LNYLADVKGDILRVYGKTGPVTTVSDTMNGAGVAYLKWKYALPPTLSQLRYALTMREGKPEALAALTSADVKVDFWPDSTEWLGGQNIVATAGRARLAAKEIKRVGCFVYADEAELNGVTGYGAHMILVGTNDDAWHAKVRAAPNNERELSYVHISKLDNEWKTYFTNQNYNGGDCSGIIKSL
jgi:hypothetical protein